MSSLVFVVIQVVSQTERGITAPAEGLKFLPFANLDRLRFAFHVKA